VTQPIARSTNHVGPVGKHAGRARRSWKLLLPAVAVALAAAALACSGDPAKTPPPGAALAFDKESVQLRGVPADQPVVQTFLLINRGNDVLMVQPPQVGEVTGCDLAFVARDGILVPPGEVVRLPVQIKGHQATEEPHSVEVIVRSNDPERRVATLLVNLEVVDPPSVNNGGPRLSVDKQFVDTGDVPYDSPLYEQFVLRNVGDKPLTLEGLPPVRVEDGC